MRGIRSVVFIGLVSGCVGLFTSPVEAAASCGEQVCASAGEWLADQTLDAKARKKQAKDNRKRGDVQLAVELSDEFEGRGSVFVDGRYLAAGSSRAIKPGKHELEVRDGDEVIALGVLVVPRGVDEVTVEIGAQP